MHDIKRLNARKSLSAEGTRPQSFQKQIELWIFSHTILADLGGFVVDFVSLSLPSSPDHNETTVPVLDKPENDRYTPEAKDIIISEAVTKPDGPRAAEESTTENVDATSRSSTGQNPTFQGTATSKDEKTTQFQQDDASKQSQNTKANQVGNSQNPVNAEQTTSYPEDPTLTHFVLYLETNFLSFGGFDWEPRPDHRQIVNSLADECHMGG